MSQRTAKKRHSQKPQHRKSRGSATPMRTPATAALESRLDEAKRELKDNKAAMAVALADEPERHPWWNRHGHAVVFGVGCVMIAVSLVTVNVNRSNANAYEAQAKAATSALSVVKTQENATTYLASIGAKLSEAGEDSEGYDEIYAAGEELDTLADSDYEYPTDSDASVSDFNDAYEANEKLLDDIEEKSTNLSDLAKKYHADWFESDDSDDSSDTADTTETTSDDAATETATETTTEGE